MVNNFLLRARKLYWKKEENVEENAENVLRDL